MRRSENGAAFAAATALVISMGFSRFAFTGLYSLMITDHQITVAGGSYAASANYAGYLIGSVADQPAVGDFSQEDDGIRHDFLGDHAGTACPPDAAVADRHHPRLLRCVQRDRDGFGIKLVDP